MPTIRIALLGLGAASSLAAAGCGASSKAAPPPTSHAGPVKVALSEYRVAASTTKDHADNGAVSLDVTNQGKIPHELVVISTTKPADGLGQPGANGKVKEIGNAGETGDLAAGQSKTIKLKLKPGHYALICNIPSHYADGMHTDFTVR